jgi:hypothetical protein
MRTLYIYCSFLLFFFIGVLPERRFPSRCRQNALGDQHRVFETLQSIASCVQDKMKKTKTKKTSWGINCVLCTRQNETKNVRDRESERDRARETERERASVHFYVYVYLYVRVCVCICMYGRACERKSISEHMYGPHMHMSTSLFLFHRAHKYT